MLKVCDEQLIYANLLLYGVVCHIIPVSDLRLKHHGFQSQPWCHNAFHSSRIHVPVAKQYNLILAKGQFVWLGG